MSHSLPKSIFIPLPPLTIKEGETEEEFIQRKEHNRYVALNLRKIICDGSFRATNAEIDEHGKQPNTQET